MWENTLGTKIRQKISLAVLVIDDFTGEVVVGNGISVSIAGERKPIRKGDGYYVFLNVKQTKCILTVEGTLYEKQAAELYLGGKDAAYSILKLRLIPNRRYPLTDNTTCIEGKAEPNSQIRMRCENVEKPFRLFHDYDPNNAENNYKISIYHLNRMNLDGKMFYIQNKDGTAKEVFCIAKTLDKENKDYLLMEKLSYSYKKAETVLQMFYLASANQNGDFFLPIANVPACRCICEAIGTKSVMKECVLAGKNNWIDLRN